MDMNTYSTTATVDFSNTKEMSIATGIVTIVLPYLLMIGIGVGGVFLFRKIKEKKA